MSFALLFRSVFLSLRELAHMDMHMHTLMACFMYEAEEVELKKGVRHGLDDAWHWVASLN